MTEREKYEHDKRREARRREERIRYKLSIMRVLFVGLLVTLIAIIIARAQQPTPAAAPTAAPVSVPAPVTMEISEPTASENTQKYYIDAVPLSHTLQDTMRTACSTYNVPYSLALAVAEVESSWDLDAVNGNCSGLMQINSINYPWLRDRLQLDPTTQTGNITAGVYMIGDLLQRYDDTTKALMCYNAGETGAARQWAKGVTSTDYTAKVLAAQSAWEVILCD